jgi:hypothetical protein
MDDQELGVGFPKITKDFSPSQILTGCEEHAFYPLRTRNFFSVSIGDRA